MDKLEEVKIDDEHISAFAFDLGRQIEAVINDRTDNLEANNKIIEAKLIQWYAKSGDEEFAKHFGIKYYGPELGNKTNKNGI